MQLPQRSILGRVLAHAGLVITLATASESGPRAYKVHNLGVLPGDATSSAASINDFGAIVGVSTSPQGVQRAFIYFPALGVHPLGSPGGSSSAATRINNRGQVIGMANTVDGKSHAFLYSPLSGTTDLNTLLGIPITSAKGLNKNGQVTGAAFYGDLSRPEPFAYLYTPGKGVTYPGASGFPFNEGVAVDDLGDVAMNLGRPPAAPYLFTSSAGLTSLTFAGGWGLGLSADLSDNGTLLVGQGTFCSPGCAMFNTAFAYFLSAKKAVNLGTLGGLTSAAFGANDAGEIVGQSATRSGSTHGFLYTPDMGMVDLNDLIPKNSGWELTTATALNKSCGKGSTTGGNLMSEISALFQRCGEIVGAGLFHGQVRAFVLTPDN